MRYGQYTINNDKKIVFEVWDDRPVLFKGTALPGNELTSDDYYNIFIYPIDENIPDYDTYQYTIDEKEMHDWLIDDVSKTIKVQYELTPISLEDKKLQLKNELAGIRYNNEISGITYDGTEFPTDRSSQMMIMATKQVIMDDNTQVIKWKCINRWIDLDISNITDVANAIKQHVEDCFYREFELVTDIEATTTLVELKEVDINSGW